MTKDQYCNAKDIFEKISRIDSQLNELSIVLERIELNSYLPPAIVFIPGQTPKYQFEISGYALKAICQEYRKTLTDIKEDLENQLKLI